MTPPMSCGIGSILPETAASAPSEAIGSVERWRRSWAGGFGGSKATRRPALMKPAHRLPSDPPRRLQTPWCEKAEICLAKNRKCREDDQYAFYYGGKIFSLVVTIGMLIVSGF